MIRRIIDEDFIKEIKLFNSTVTWCFDDDDYGIVPENLRHDYLLRNNIIDKEILKFYYKPSSSLISKAEFEDLKTNGFANPRELALRPYSNIIFGAYHSRLDLYEKLKGLIYYNRKHCINGKDVKCFSDLIPYFKDYAEGFKNGFDNFDSKQVKPYLTLLADKEDYVNKVFEFVTKEIVFKHGWASLVTGFATKLTEAEIVNGYEDGQKQGYFYRAWSIIFSNQNLFTTLFHEHSKAFYNQLTGKDEVLSDLITHTKSKEIVNFIKVNYKNIRGKRLKLLLLVFQELQLLPKERIAQSFHNCCKNEFKWDIASYNAMNGYNYNKHTDSETIEEMKANIKKIIEPT
jgi:hypothetical protein